jgi:hypothetical protein
MTRLGADQPDGVADRRETDLMMLVCHNGGERTLAEFGELLVQEGFRLESVGETGCSYKLITASVA